VDNCICGFVDTIRFLDEISIHIVPGHASYMRYSDELKPETMRFRNCNRTCRGSIHPLLSCSPGCVCVCACFDQGKGVQCECTMSHVNTSPQT